MECMIKSTEDNVYAGNIKYKNLKVNDGLAMHKKSLDFEHYEDLKIDLFNTDFPDESPYVIYFGKDGEKIAVPLRKLKVKLAILTSTSNVSASNLLKAAKDFTRFIFRRAEDENSRGVYFCGLEIGCSIISKILADRHLIEELPSSGIMSGVFLFAGIFDTNLENKIRENSSTTKRKISIIEKIPQTLIHNILEEHKAFECRTNFSSVCDYAYEPLPIRGFFRSRSVMLKKGSSGAEFKQRASLRKDTLKSREFIPSKAQHEIEFPFVDKEELNFLSSSLDDHSHCVRRGIRIYIIAAGADEKVLVKQSRDMFVKLVEYFNLKDLHYEVKFDVNLNGMKLHLIREDSTLIKLLKHDLKRRKHDL